VVAYGVWFLTGVFYWDHDFLHLVSGFGNLGPLSVYFIWSAIKGRCWTKRGLPHPSVCPVCDQADETIKHTLVACVSTRQVWTAIFHVLGLLPLTFLAGGAKQSRLFQKS